MMTTRKFDGEAPFMNAARTRRGLAMMLVVVALVVGTVIAGVAISTQSMAPQIGANAQDAAQARWSAESAADYAAAVLETSIALSSITEGSMMSDFTIAGGSVDVTVTNLVGNTPDDADRDLIVTAAASVNGVSVVARRQVSLGPPPSAPAQVDPYLSEFAIFANNGLTIAAGARIGKWSRSPEARSTTPLKIGTGFANLASLNIARGADVRNAAIYMDATATATLLNELSSNLFVSGAKIPLDLPARHVSIPAAVSGLAYGGTNTFTYNTKGASVVFPQNREYSGSLIVDNGSELILDASVSPAYAFGGIFMINGGVLKIRGDVDVEVNGALNLVNKARIEVEPGGHLDLFVRGNVYLQRSAIGAEAAAITDSGCDPNSLTRYTRPDTVRILSPASPYANQTFLADDRALVAASVHMPAAASTVTNQSTIIGRLTGKTISIGTGSAVYADTALDNLAGFTNLDGPLYQSNGNPLAGVVSLLTGVLAILHVNKTAEEFAATINSAANASVEAPEAPADGATARNTRSTVVVEVPVRAKVIERSMVITDDDDDVSIRVVEAETDDDV